VSILTSALVGCVAFGPFKSWKSLVEVITGATAMMYAFAPIALASLRKLDPARPRSYKMPAPHIILPAAFCSANLIIYWGGFGNTWKLVVAIAAGLVLFGVGAAITKSDAVKRTLRNASWVAPWLIGQVVLGALGNYGDVKAGQDGFHVLPMGYDVALVIAFALAIFYYAVSVRLTASQSAEAVAKDAHQLDNIA